jgi:hypothetical protein
MSGYRDLTQENPTDLYCKTLTSSGFVQVAAINSLGGITSFSDITTHQNLTIDGVLTVAKSADPAMGKNGDIYFNTTSHKWVYCTGSAWVAM